MGNTFGGMNFNTVIAALSGGAIEMLEGFDREAALDAGMSQTTANNWKLVHDAYYGPTTSPSKQRQAREKARAQGVSLDKLVHIEKKLKPIKNNRTRNKLRLTLLAVRGNYKALLALARKLLPGADTPPEKKMTISPSRHGRRRVVFWADERDVADLEYALLEGVDPDMPLAPQLLEHFLALIRDGGGVPYAVPRPQLLIPLPEWVRIIRGEGDDVVLGLTDGTTTTGADFLTTHTANPDNELEAIVFHPTEGAVNQYRLERFANAKQRDMARATQPICTSPDCRRGADQCEIHHIKAWKNGGETNVNNLAPLCRYHNRVNDDDAHLARRGHAEMRGGAPVWVSPRGFARTNKLHPFGGMRSLFNHDPSKVPAPAS